MAEYDANNLRDDIFFLASYFDYKLQNISERTAIGTTYRRVSENYQYVDSIVVRKILEAAPRPMELKANTIGSFLFGCLQSYYGDLPQYCSALCIGNMLKPVRTCDLDTYLQTEKSLIPIGTPIGTTNANLFLTDQKSSVRESTYDILESYGVKYVSIYLTIKSKHKLLQKSFNIEKRKNKQTTLSELVRGGAQEIGEGGGGYGLILILVLLLILIAGFGFTRMKK